MRLSAPRRSGERRRGLIEDLFNKAIKENKDWGDWDIFFEVLPDAIWDDERHLEIATG